MNHANKHDVLAQVLRTAREKRQLCLQNRWKLKKPSGEVVVLRDLMEKIISWLDTFKAIGDVAMQYDTAHASLAWASVRFLLQGSFSDSNEYGH